MKQEHKILFSDLSSITDRASRVYIENQIAIILSRKAPTYQYKEHKEGTQSQYHGSQYRAFCYQGDQAQRKTFEGEHVQRQQPQIKDQSSPSDKKILPSNTVGNDFSRD